MPISKGSFVMPLIASDGIQVIDVTEDSIRIAGRPYQPVRDQKLAEPVALSSTVSTGFGLPPTTTRYGFDLVALRARRKRNLRNRGSPRKTSRDEVRAICAKTLRRRDVGDVVGRAALPPDPNGAAQGREPGRDRALVRPHRVAVASGHGVA